MDNRSFAGGTNMALNAHIDVVPPFFPPRLEGEHLFGRGTADDKGNIAVILGVLDILNELVEQEGLELQNRITSMFVIDEEIGGNGSLSLCLDPAMMDRFETMVTLECTSKRIHPANRGAVHIKCEVGLQGREPRESGSHISPLEAIAYGILELDEEGDRIKKESRHRLFPHRPVQTCMGMIGPFGDHPSTLCGELEFQLCELTEGIELRTIAKILRRGLSAYITKHGDKTRSRDTATGLRKVHHHLSFRTTGADDLLIKVHGASGHMGSLPRNDSALTKWAFMAKELVESRLKGELSYAMHLGDVRPGGPVVFEGAQGFLPTHGIEQIMKRTAEALSRGVKRYLSLLDAEQSRMNCDVSFKKLHNDAFSSRIRPGTLKKLKRAALQTGVMSKGQPLIGWDVSCDSRLFAKAKPSLSVLTSGVGNLEQAHSDKEMLYVPDLFQFIEFLTLFVIRETGSVFRDRR
jgi:acetylornithine deacetylase/succinyl-diaminopimelate desuccinylase-like protein